MKEHHLEIEALAKNLSQVRECVTSWVDSLGFDSEQIYHIVLAVDEACSNVIRHAYPGEEDINNKIILDADICENKIKIKIKDYGIRVDSSGICGRNIEDVQPGGLGVHLMHGCMDEVFFNPDIEKGNELILIKNFNS